MVAMLHLNFSGGVCLEVSNDHSWSLGMAADSGDEVPCPVMQGSALFSSNNFFPPPAEYEYDLKIQNNFAKLVKTLPGRYIKHLLMSPCRGDETCDTQVETLCRALALIPV